MTVKLKKALAVIAAAIMAFSPLAQVSADDMENIQFSFKDSTSSPTDGKYMDYDEESGVLHAYSDQSGTAKGEFEAEKACTSDGTVLAFNVKALSDSHVRTKIFLKDSNGTNILTTFALCNSGKFRITDTANTAYIATYDKSLNEDVRIEYTFDFTAAKVSIRLGSKADEGYSFSDPVEKSISGSSFKTIQISTEWAKSDMEFSALSLLSTVNDEDNPGEDDKDTAEMSFPEEEDEEYITAFTEGFSNVDSAVVSGTNTNATHYAKVNTEKHRIELKNDDGQGSCKAAIYFPQAYNKDGTRIALTYLANDDHVRTKVFFGNSGAVQIHQNNLTYSGGNLYISDTGASRIDNSLATVGTGVPVRLELEFDFTNQKVNYRTALVKNGKWNFGAWVTDKNYLGTVSAAELELGSLIFSNEYAKCDMYLDDVRVSVPKPKPEAENVKITNMVAEFPITRDELVGEYEYVFDEEEGESEFSWVVSDNVEFTSSTEIGKENKIALNADCANKYIKFMVTPVSKSGLKGKTFESAAVGPVKLVVDEANPPEARDVKISGNCYVKGILSASYVYYDSDYDKESGTVIEWYTVNGSDEKLIKAGSDEAALTLEITEDMLGMTIKLTIIPKNAGDSATEGIPHSVLSEKVKYSPVYEDYINLSLTPPSGSTLTGDIYLPMKGANGSEIVWSSSVPDSIGVDGSVIQKSSAVSVTLTAEIKSENISYEKSFTYTVSAKPVPSGGSSWGGGGGRKQPDISFVGSIAEQQAMPSYEQPEVFEDLEGSEWAKDAVITLYNKGIVSGTGEKRFEPGRNVTRAEFIKMVVGVFGLKGNSEIKFADTTKNDWFYPYISAAVANGIVNGITDEYFGANDEITREDMAVIVFRAAKFSGADNNNELFEDDGNISDYAKEAVYALKQKGIVSGTGNGNFSPKSKATRAEVAKILWSFAE